MGTELFAKVHHSFEGARASECRPRTTFCTMPATKDAHGIAAEHQMFNLPREAILLLFLYRYR
jgi:hypothetical protein